jgi:hypothetical protein
VSPMTPIPSKADEVSVPKISRQQSVRAHGLGEAGKRQVPRLALTRAEAADCLGMSVDSFERHVQPEVRLIRRGRMRLVPVRELERWAKENATFTLDRMVR